MVTELQQLRIYEAFPLSPNLLEGQLVGAMITLRSRDAIEGLQQLRYALRVRVEEAKRIAACNIKSTGFEASTNTPLFYRFGAFLLSW